MVNAIKKNTVKRPAIWMTSAFAVGIICGAFCAKTSNLVHISIIVSGLLALFLCLLLQRKTDAWIFVCVLCFAAAIFLSYFAYLQRYEQKEFSQSKHLITATVRDYDKISDKSIRYEIDSVEIDFKSYPNLMLLTVNGEDIIEVGSNIQLHTKIYKPKASGNDGLFDYASHLADNGIYHIAYADIEDVVVTENKTLYSPIHILNKFKHGLARTAQGYLSDEAMGIIYSVTSGDDLYISEATYSQYRRTGTAHVLVISGLHVGFAAMFASLLTRRLRKYSVSYTLINLIIVWTYIIFAGMNVSAVRAGLFFSLFCIGKSLRCRCDVINISFVTAFIILAFDPLAIFSASFQMSFAAVLAIGLLSPTLSELFFKTVPFLPKSAVNSLSTVIAASIGVLLPVAYHFNNISPVSMVVNLIAVPLFSVITAFGFIVMLFAALNIPFLLSAFAAIANGLVGIAHAILGFVSSWEYAHIDVPSPDIVTIPVVIMLIIVLSVEKPAFIKSRLPAVIVLVATLIAGIIYPYCGIKPALAKELNMGEAHCAFISTPYNNVILVNAGSENENEATANYTIIPYVLKHESRDIDYIVITSNDMLYSGSLEYIVNGIKVHNIICFDENKEYVTKVCCSDNNNVSITVLDKNEFIKIDGKTFIHRDNNGKIEIIYEKDILYTEKEIQ